MQPLDARAEADALQRCRALCTAPGLMTTMPFQMLPGIFPENHNSGECFPTTQKVCPGTEGWYRPQGSPPLRSRHGSCPCLPQLLLAASHPRDLARP